MVVFGSRRGRSLSKGPDFMKVAITAQGRELESQIDLRFGRAKLLTGADADTGDFKVQDNTVNLNAAQGTCSRVFFDRFNKADLVIAKGQGNYESLSEADKNIFFILKAKYPVIAGDLGCEVEEMILRRSETFEKRLMMTMLM